MKRKRCRARAGEEGRDCRRAPAGGVARRGLDSRAVTNARSGGYQPGSAVNERAGRAPRSTPSGAHADRLARRARELVSELEALGLAIPTQPRAGSGE